MLYQFTIALGLFLGAISFMVEPRAGRATGFTLSAASFAVAALNAAGAIN